MKEKLTGTEAVGRGTVTIKPVFVVGGLYSEASGVTRIMSGLANALGRRGIPVVACGADCGRGRNVRGLFQPPARWITSAGKWLGGLSWSPAVRGLLHQEIQRADLVHNHMAWMLPTHYSTQIARAAAKPVLFTPHGCMERWALQRASWKKRLAALWFQDRDLRQTTCIHVTSWHEVADVRAYGLGCPVAVVPNGVDPALFDHLPPPSELAASFPELAGKRVLLFLGRLHVKKGLGHLVRAWGRVRSCHDDWHLMIAGPNEGFERPTRRLAADLRLERALTITGQLDGRARLAAFAAADAFVLPSFSEGFSIAVLEAMAARLPVLLSPKCNFPEAVRAGAAVEAAPTVEGTEQGLRQLLDMSDRERAEMGQRGRRLVESTYTWNGVAAQMHEIYNWLTGHIRPPGCIVYD